MILRNWKVLSTDKNNSAGLSLVEIVVSMLILSLIVAGGYAVFISGTRFVTGQKARIEALSLARQSTEQLLSYGNNTVNYWSLPASGGITIPANSALETFSGSGVRTVSNGTNGAVAPGDRYKIITANIVWTEPSL